MSVPPLQSAQAPAPQQTPDQQAPNQQAPNQQAWDKALAQYTENAAIPLLASMGLAAIQQATKGAGDN